MTTSWTNFDVYEPEVGGGKPFYVTQYATLPFPGLLCVTEEFDNKGLIFTAPLPTRVADALMSPASLAKVHEYRDPAEALPPIVERLGWLG